jgi:hypothetical protein
MGIRMFNVSIFPAQVNVAYLLPEYETEQGMTKFMDYDAQFPKNYVIKIFTGKIVANTLEPATYRMQKEGYY